MDTIEVERPVPRRHRERAVESALSLATLRFGDELTLHDLAFATSLPVNTLTRRFQRRFGLSPMRWLWLYRTVLAAELIETAPSTSLTTIALHCGFASSAHFSRRFRVVFGQAPSSYRTLAVCGILSSPARLAAAGASPQLVAFALSSSDEPRSAESAPRRALTRLLQMLG